MGCSVSCPSLEQLDSDWGLISVLTLILNWAREEEKEGETASLEC